MSLDTTTTTPPVAETPSATSPDTTAIEAKSSVDVLREGLKQFTDEAAPKPVAPADAATLEDQGDDAEKEEDKPEGAVEGEKPAEEPAEEPEDDSEEGILARELPRNTRERTKRSFEKLKGYLRERTERAETAEKERDGLVSMITETGTSADQFRDFLGYMKAVNSGDPAQIRQALPRLQRELEAVARMAGVAVPGINFVKDHPDLLQALQEGKITVQHAQEIAATRHSTQFMQHQSQQRIQQQEQQNTAQQGEQQGVQALNDLGMELAKRDPQFEAKKAILVPLIKPILSGLPPSQWAKAFWDAYQNVRVPAAAPTPKPTATQPLRGKVGAQGNPLSAPGKSTLDVVRHSLAELRGG